MKNISKIILPLMTGLTLIGCGSSGGSKEKVDINTKTQLCAGMELSAGNQCISIDNREAISFVPNGEVKGIAILLHGAPGLPSKVANIFGAEALASEHNLLTVVPQGVVSGWAWDSTMNNLNQENADTQYFSQLIDELSGDYQLADAKAMILGYSAGGFMGYKLACQIPEKLSAVVSLAGQFRGDFSSCTTATTVPIHHLHNPQDKEVPMSGRSRGSIRSVDDTLAHWQAINGCSEQTETYNLGAVIANTEDASVLEFQGCSQSVKFSRLYSTPHESDYVATSLRSHFDYLIK